MSFNKANTRQESGFDEVKRLMCTFPGCENRWSVHINGAPPKCSEHQWMGLKKPSNKLIDAWYNEKDN